MPPQRSFGAQLRWYRERAGFSQEALAERAGIGVATLAALERDQRQRPHPRTLATLTDALGLPPVDRDAFMNSARQPEPLGASPVRSAGLPSRGAATTPRRPHPPGAPIGGRHNLPGALSSMVGRRQELAELVSLLETSRLVTLTGSGGVGKTRLALEVAATSLHVHPDGVWLVSLAPITDPALVPHALATAVGVAERGGQPLLVTLTEALRERRALVVLDNCEHLVQTCAELVESLLQACPGLTILTTSREPLGVAGEVTWRVPSLGLPAPPPPPPEQLSQYEAVRLFVERAVAARPDFRVTNANAPAVAEVCCRLDGIPLAIELAAAWVRTLSVEQLAARLDDRFRLLVGGGRTAPARQQTLRGAMEWSYELLTDPERWLFAALSVFAGGWTLEAAEAVCPVPSVRVHRKDEVPAQDILGLLRQLVDKSLVVVAETPDGTRYRLLETLRAYGREQAQAMGVLATLEQRHRSWCVRLAESAAPEALDASHIARLAREHDNVRAGLRSTIDRGDAELGLRLGVALWPLWFVRGLYTEGQAWLDEILALPGALPASPARARALAFAGHLAYCRSDYVTAERRLEDARMLARGPGTEAEAGVALLFLGHVARVRGDMGRARERYLAAREIHQRQGNRAWEAVTVSNLALLLEECGEDGPAELLGAEGLALARASGHLNAASRMLGLLGRIALDSAGRHATARQLLEESLQLQREVGYQQGLAWTLLALGRVAHAEGDSGQAGRLVVEGLARAQEAGDKLTLVRGLEVLASVVASTLPERAVWLAGAANALRQSLGADLLPAERERQAKWQSEARGGLSETAYDAAWSDGQQHTADQAIAVARTSISE